LVRTAIEDLENSALPEKDKALLRFIRKVNHRAWEIVADDMKPLYAAGLTDEAIYYAITVCALFNFYNRWIDASGVHVMSEKAHREFGKRTAMHGYIPK
jgi:alkylhydroperoxidase family enzyme